MVADRAGSGSLSAGGVAGIAESLAEALFSLDEPWRDRFLALVAEWATGRGWHGRRPRRAEVESWLRADIRLCREIWSLLNAWGGGSCKGFYE